MNRYVKFLALGLIAVSLISFGRTFGEYFSESSEFAVEAKGNANNKKPPNTEACRRNEESKACDRDMKKAKEAREKAEALERREAREVGCVDTKKRNDKGEMTKSSCSLQGGAVGRACGDGEKSVKASCGGTDCGSVVTSGGGVCTNAREICVSDGGGDDCTCKATNCPTALPPDKFRTLAQSTGVHLTCSSPNSCTAVSQACTPTYVNAPPTCSILPNLIKMDREDSPKQFQLSVSDTDYGDAVEIVGVQVVDAAGKLNTCIDVTSTAGSSLIGTTVRSGLGDASQLSQSTSFMVDPRQAHGIFGNVNGESRCDGTLQILITDLDGDGPSGPDKASSEPVKCSVKVEITNRPPTLKKISLWDRDERILSRDTEDLINSNNPTVYVGSTTTSEVKSRASYCNEALSLLDPITCPMGAEEYVGKRHNPLLLEFTVSDENGADDLMQAGVWLQLQQTGANNNTATVPLTGGGSQRTSFQALYSEKESKDIDGVSYFISRGCLTPSCGEMNLRTSSKQKFSALALVTSLPEYAGDGSTTGNIVKGKQRVATTNEWHQVRFPDCLNGGCTSVNVPDTAKTPATADTSIKANYAWAISADTNSFICYPNNGGTPTVVAVGTPPTCPSSCAACIKKEGVVQGATANEMTFRFGIYFNDKDTGAGMPEGKYSVYISALDKVGVPLNNVSISEKGAEGWTRFDKSGNVCTGAACASGTDFTLHYDPIPPTVTFDKWTPNGTTEVTATAKVLDNAGGSGVNGVSNRFIARQEFLDGEPLEDRVWAQKMDGTPFDGKSDIDRSFTGSALSLQGKGLVAEESIVAGACAFDKAGNMGCGRNDNEYIFLSAWIKTSFGDIFSSRGSSAPFALSIPSNMVVNTFNNNDNTRKLDSLYAPYTDIYAPFSEQIFTVGTGLLMTSSTTGSGLTGGYVASSTSATSFPLGFKNNYREALVDRAYNVFGVKPLMSGNEYEQLRSYATTNCELMNETVTNTCQSNGVLASVGAAQYNIINVSNATIDSLLCRNVNLIFVSGTLTVKGDITKQDSKSGCIFVVASNGSLTIEDVPSNQRTATADNKGIPHTDRFQAAIIANAGGQISVKKPDAKSTNKSIDRLEIQGWVYSANTAPRFLRSLAPVDNRRYPSEWIVYDATLLDLFRPFLGAEKTVDLTCGTSQHILCTTVN